MTRPDIETEAEFWHGYPYDWPEEASDRIIAALRAEHACDACDGRGERQTGRIPADVFGPAEPILTRCEWCSGTGRRPTTGDIE